MILQHPYIRKILIYIEENIKTSRDIISLNKLATELLIDIDTITYHVKQLTDGEFITKSETGVVDLTFKGHEYISAIRDEDLWETIIAPFDEKHYISLEAVYTAANQIAVLQILNNNK